MGISDQALRALWRRLHKESKNLPAVEMQPQETSKADFSRMFWWNGNNQRSEIHVCCFKGPSDTQVMCLGERQVARIPRASLECEWLPLQCSPRPAECLHGKIRPGFVATGNPLRKTEPEANTHLVPPYLTTLIFFPGDTNFKQH